MGNDSKYLFHIVGQNIGPHLNLNKNLAAGESGQVRIGIFASNGGGKSSISRQFRLIRLPSDNLPSSNKYLSLGQQTGSFKFKLYQQENTQNSCEIEIQHTRDETPKIKNDGKLLYHVFNSDYVKETIEPHNFGQDNNIEGYIIGKSAIDLNDKRIELEALRTKFSAIKKEIESSIQDGCNELQSNGVRANTSEYKAITFDSILSNTVPVQGEMQYLEIKRSLDKLRGIPDNIDDVPTLKINFEFDLDLLKCIIDDLKEDVSISKLSDEFKASIRTKETFIIEGVKLLEPNYTTCPFCEQKLESKQTELIDGFIEFVNDAETKYIIKLRNKLLKIQEVINILNNKRSEFLKVESLYNNVRSYFPSYKDKGISLIEEVNINWEEIIDIINCKISNVSSHIPQEVIEIISNANNYIIEYNNQVQRYIVDNNNLIEDINRQKNNTNNELLRLRKSLSLAKHYDLSVSLASKIKELKLIELEGKSKANDIKSIEEKETTSKKELYANTFSTLLEFIFKDKYVYNKDDSSLTLKEHSLKMNAQDILSDGEKSIIAFCCYLSETHDIIKREDDYKRLFFIIDDPISSMDFHYTYTLCRILERLNLYFPSIETKDLKFMLFTHNIEFMSILMRNNSIRKKYVLTHSDLKALSKELIMPYHEHLADLYKVASKTIEPTHTTPNSMRNVLETIARFENPTQSLITYIDNNEILKGCSSLHNMFQDLSHGVYRSQTAVLPDDIIEGCKVIIRFVEERYVGQIENIKKSI